MKCFYHSADLDGKCSAAIVWSYYKNQNIELIGINYGQEFPWDRIVDNEDVIMVDFCLQPFSDMEKLRQKSRLIWIDHHKTAIEAAQKSDSKWDLVPGIRQDGIGACQLTWKFLYPHRPVPKAVVLIAQHDVWDHSDPGCEPFQYGMRLEDTDPSSPVWRWLFKDEPHYEDHIFNRILRAGESILTYQQEQNKGHAKTLCFDTNVDGFHVIAANAGPNNSSFFDGVWDPEKYQAMCLFQWRPKENCWVISLYTTREDVDVSAICKARGGGGHKKAAGFQSKSFPFWD